MIAASVGGVESVSMVFFGWVWPVLIGPFDLDTGLVVVDSVYTWVTIWNC